MDGLIDIEIIKAIVGEALGSQVGQFTIAFAIAAWIHSGRMKKEISVQLSSITGALNNLATALRQDLKTQSERIEKVEFGYNELKVELSVFKRGQNGHGDQRN